MNNKRRTVLLALAGLICAFGLAYAMVPLYKAFCQATGFGGTVRKSETAPKNVPLNVSQNIVRVHFDVNTNALNWRFKSQATYQDTPIGKTALMYFSVKNLSDHAVTGRAVYNVVPESMGPYFMKIECFCFTDQTLKAGEEKTFPVVYFIDPKLLDDVEVKTLRDVTLSYTFFESKDAKT